MNVIVLKDSGDFFFDEAIEIGRCPLCERSIYMEPFERVHDNRTLWSSFESLFIARRPTECPECGHRISVLVPANIKVLPESWEVRYV